MYIVHIHIVGVERKSEVCKCLTDYIHEVEASIGKEVGNNFVEVKLLLQSHGELCCTMEALSQQV